MESQETTNNMTELVSANGKSMVKPNTSLPSQGFQARPQGPPPPSLRNPINNGPISAPRPGQPPHPLRRLDSHSSVGPPASSQFVQLRPYGPPRPPGGSFPPRSPQPGQNLQNPLRPANQRFAHIQGIRGPSPQPTGQRPLFAGNYQAYQVPQQQQRSINDIRFPRPIPDIAPQNGPPRNVDVVSHRPGQESIYTRQLLKHDSSLSLQRQHLLSNEEIKQPTRPRIIIEKMMDINESSGEIDKPESYPQKKKPDGGENGENDNDDDDDVIVDKEKSRNNADNIHKESMNGSKSPLITKRYDDTIKSANISGRSTFENKREGMEGKQDGLSKPISANADNDTVSNISQSKPISTINNDMKEEKKGIPDGNLKSNKNVHIIEESKEEDAKNEIIPPFINDSRNDKTSRTISEPTEKMKKIGDHCSNDISGRLQHNLKVSSKSPDDLCLDTSQNVELDLSQSLPKSPKTFSNTPSHLDTSQSVEQDLKKLSKITNKSCSNNSTRLEPSRNAEQEWKTSMKTPDRSRSTTPGSVSCPNAEKELEKSQESMRRDETGEDILQANGPNKSTYRSSLGTSNLTNTKGDKSSVTLQDKLSVPKSMKTPPRSPQESVKGFDNGQRRSLSSRSSPSSSPRSPISPKSPTDSGKQIGNEKKQTSITTKKTVEIADRTPDPESIIPSKSIIAKTRRVQTPAKLDYEKTRQKSAERKAFENGRAIDSQSNASREADKRSVAGSPTKSPSKSAKSLPRTPDTPSSITAQEKKKVSMNKVQVGAAPSPNLKTVRSKIGSLDNASYKPGGGKVKIENRKLDFSKAQPKIAAKNEKYAPSGGDKKIAQVKLQWNAKSKIGSLDNATYKPGGGDKKIETVKLDFKDKAKSKVGSKENAKHIPGGGTVKSASPPKTPQEAKSSIPTQKIDIKAESKIGSLDNVKHKPGGGDKKIFNDRDYLRQTSSNVESLNGSGSQVQTPVQNDRHPQTNSNINDSEILQPQPPPSTPTRTRIVTSPSSIVTPRAIRSGLAKSPEATMSGRQMAIETDVSTLANGRAPKTLSSNAVDNRNLLKTSTPKSPKSPKSPVSSRPPSSLRIKSERSPRTSGKTSPSTPSKISPKELHLPKLASSPTTHETTLTHENPSKITLPKLIESSSPSTRVAY